MNTLIIIDAQNDFMPGGSLAVPDGDKIIPVINALQEHFDLVIATQDWHPEGHGSFASAHAGKQAFDKTQLNGLEQILWPDHCVQKSKGADFHPDLEQASIEAIFRKGMDPGIDSYSGFYDNGHKKNTGLAGYLRERGAKELYFCGLAADVCVQYSVKDAIREGFSARLITDATRAIDGDAFEDIRQELKEKGCRMMQSDELIRSM
ncbi:MAG: bifunctional nicotinamidase/pyrazinamidase [Bacteroidales bacterium]